MTVSAKIPARPAASRRVKTPTVLQMEAAECGAAALGMLLGHYGRFVPLIELRETVGVSRDGTNAKAILHAARLHGLEAAAYRREPADLKTHPLPVIVWWEFDHFLVVEGYSAGRWYLNDPASGRRSVSDEDFGRAFTGIVLDARPGADFQRSGRRPSAWLALMERVSRSRLALLYVVLAGVAMLAPGLAVPALTRAFVDGALVSDRTALIGPILVGLVLAAVVQGALTWLQAAVTVDIRAVLGIRMYAAQTQRLLALPMRFFLQRAAGDVAYRASLGGTVAGVVTGPLVASLVGLVVAAAYIGIVFSLDALLGLVVLVGSLAVVAAILRTAGRQRDLSNRAMREQIDAAVAKTGTLALIETVKAQGAEDEAMARISAARARLVAARAESETALLPLLALPAAVSGIMALLLLAIGAGQVMSSQITLGTLLAIQFLSAAALAPLSTLASLTGQVQQIAAVIDRIDDIEDSGLDDEIQARLGGRRADLDDRPVEGRITFDEVSFGYSLLTPPLIRDFSLDIPVGSRVAIVGASGSGKSTVAKLVVGLLSPTSGRVLVDGRERVRFERETLAEGIGYVEQSTALFSASVRDNITLWDDEVDEVDLVSACRDAGIHDVIAARPGGYDGLLGEGGRGLSGGEAQRVEIARALLRNPRIVVLDEATSALDPLTELQIVDAVSRRGCTTVIVAHRLSTVRDADLILVLDRGEVVEQGTHDRLVSLDGAYARLVRA